MPRPVPTKKVVHNGVEFDVPVGYASIEAFAETVRFNRTHANRLRMSAETRVEYDALIAKLVEAGL